MQQWCEVSIKGNIYTLREHTDMPGQRMGQNYDNQLTNGSVIDICGVRLLFQTPDAMARQHPVRS